MGTRWVLHESRVDGVDGREVLDRIIHEIQADMITDVPKDKNVLVTGIEVTSITSERARIVITRPGGGGGHGPSQAQYAEEVPYFVEFGTRHSRAQPFIRRNVYKRRSP